MKREQWDERYAGAEYAYGAEPNEFLRDEVARIPAGPVLCLAEGQGRNAVYLATRGHAVTAVDFSRTGLARAAQLAGERGVRVELVEADLATFDLGDDAWSGVAGRAVNRSHPVRVACRTCGRARMAIESFPVVRGSHVGRCREVTMCELLAMSARYPTNLHLSMDELARHGGGSGPHRDGWGIAYVQDRDALIVREPDAAHGSRQLAFLQARDPTSTIVIAHIRRATQGAPLLRNTQPFSRELGGRLHLFAHNGMVPGIERDRRSRVRWYRPIGDTDSEHAFCALLDRLRPLWDRGEPSVDDRMDEVVAFAADLRQLGPANFLYSDGDVVFAHGHRRRTDAGAIAPPGLHVLCRRCRDDPAAGGEQEVALVASVPLTDEPWRPLDEGQVIALRDGRVIRSVAVTAADRRTGIVSVPPGSHEQTSGPETAVAQRVTSDARTVADLTARSSGIRS